MDRFILTKDFLPIWQQLSKPLLRDAELGMSDFSYRVGRRKSTGTFQGHKVQFFGCKTHPLHLAFGGKFKTSAKTKLACLKIIKQIVGEFFGSDGLTSLDMSVSFAQKASVIKRRFGEKERTLCF